MSKSLLRSLKNMTGGYSSVEIQVRKATSGESWGPTSQELNEIALLTYHDTYVFEIATSLIARLKEKGKKWRHILKALTVVLYCLVEGSDVFALEMRKHIELFKSLRTFLWVNSKSIDRGGAIRDKALSINELLENENKLKQGKREYRRIRREMGTPGILDLQDGALSRPRNSFGNRQFLGSDRSAINTSSPAGSAGSEGNGKDDISIDSTNWPPSNCDRQTTRSLDHVRPSIEGGRFSLSISPLQAIQEEYDGTGEGLVRILTQHSTMNSGSWSQKSRDSTIA